MASEMTLEVPTAAGAVRFGPGQDLALIAGPCVIESEEHVHFMAQAIGAIAGAFVFKASFDKANRTSVAGFRGPGLKEGLRILGGLRAAGYAVLTDIHEPAQAEAAARSGGYSADSGVPVPPDRSAAGSRAHGQDRQHQEGPVCGAAAIFAMRRRRWRRPGTIKIILTERGSSFGYNNLVVDMRGLRIMGEFGWPVVFDATHSVQLPRARPAFPADSRSSLSRLHRRRSRWGYRGCSSKCTTIRSARCRMARTRCGWTV